MAGFSAPNQHFDGQQGNVGERVDEVAEHVEVGFPDVDVRAAGRTHPEFVATASSSSTRPAKPK
jgi:hypothetical protein